MSKMIPDIRNEYRFVNVGLVIVFIALLVIPLFVAIPELSADNTKRIIKIPPCTIKAATGHPCPSCGLTRSIMFLYQGEIEKSREYHPAGFLVVIWIVFELLLRMRFLWKTKKAWLPWADICQFILSGIVFNIII